MNPLPPDGASNAIFPDISEHDREAGGIKLRELFGVPEPAEPVAQPSRWAMLRGKVMSWWARITLTMPVSVVFWIALVLAWMLAWTLYSVFSVRGDQMAEQQAQSAAPHLLDLDRRILALENLADEQYDEPMEAMPPARSQQRRAAPAIPAAAPQPWSQAALAPVPAAPRWGATDLDRAIADFTPTTNFGATP